MRFLNKIFGEPDKQGRNTGPSVPRPPAPMPSGLGPATRLIRAAKKAGVPHRPINDDDIRKMSVRHADTGQPIALEVLQDIAWMVEKKMEEANRDGPKTKEILCGCDVTMDCPLGKKGSARQCTVSELKTAVRRANLEAEEQRQHRGKLQQEFETAMRDIEALHEAINAKGLRALKHETVNGDYSYVYVLVPDDEQVSKKEPKTLYGVRLKSARVSATPVNPKTGDIIWDMEQQLSIPIEDKQPIVLTPGESTGWAMTQNNKLLGAFVNLRALGQAVSNMVVVERKKAPEPPTARPTEGTLNGW